VSLQQINLLNPQLLTPHIALSSKTIAWTLLGVVVTGLILYGWVASKSGAIQAQHDHVQTQRDALQTQIDALNQPTDDGQTREDKRAQAVAQEKQRIAQLKRLQSALGAVQGQQGFSSRLLALTNEGLPGVWLTDIGFGQTGFLLRGRALQSAHIPDYLTLLSRQPALQDLSLNGFKILPQAEDEPENKMAAVGVAFVVNPMQEKP
jgi:Tfp pilus assembly protein PilN